MGDIMQLKKEFEELYFIDVTSDYIVLNDCYRGLLILDFDFNIVRGINLGDDIAIGYSITTGNKILLFCYENECAFYVDLELLEIKRIEMNSFSDIYFLELFEWNKDNVYLLGDNGEICIKIDLANCTVAEFPNSLNNSLKNHFREILKYDVYAYDSLNNSVLTVQDEAYVLFDYKNKNFRRMNINKNVERADHMPSDQIYCKTCFNDNTIVRISERNIQIISSGNTIRYLYPPHESYRYNAGRMVKGDNNNAVIALCSDNSCNSAPFVIKYLL